MNWAILVAAGQGTRMGLGYNKCFALLSGQTVLHRSLKALLGSPHVQGVVLVAAEGEQRRAAGIARAVAQEDKPVAVTPGGSTRRESVSKGLGLVPQGCDLVLIHDGARPLLSPQVLEDAVAAAAHFGCAAPAIPVSDTLKQADEAGMVLATPDRTCLWAVQTPQVFRRALIEEAHIWAAEHLPDATDDTLLVEQMGKPVKLTRGEARNLKITTPADLRIAEAFLAEEKREAMRVGTGYDVHRLVAGRPLLLLGEPVPFEKGLLGHSDADVAAHALADALLGAAGLGDIGRHFPDGDHQYKDADSMELLARVVALLAGQGWAPGNADITIVAQRPKLMPYIPSMRARTARVLNLPEAAVNVKATTTEGLGFEGEGLGISAQAVVTIVPAGTDNPA